RGAAAGADRRLALPRSGVALWRSGPADRPQPVSRGRRVCTAALDGRRRPRAPSRPPAPRPHRRAVHCFATALPPRRILASPAAQPVLPLALFRRGIALPDRAALRLMRRTLVLFVRAPLLGSGKRRLAREVGDVAAMRFEQLMIALLLRRLAKDGRWRLRIAVTPDKACRSARHWCGGVEAVGQGEGDLGIRMRRALETCPPGPVVLVGADIPALDARHIAAALRLLGRHDLVFGPAEDGGFWLVGARHPRRLPPLFERVRWSGPDALADALAGLPRRIKLGYADTLEDVDDAEAYRRLNPTRGF